MPGAGAPSHTLTGTPGCPHRPDPASPSIYRSTRRIHEVAIRQPRRDLASRHGAPPRPGPEAHAGSRQGPSPLRRHGGRGVGAARRASLEHDRAQVPRARPGAAAERVRHPASPAVGPGRVRPLGRPQERERGQRGHRLRHLRLLGRPRLRLALERPRARRRGQGAGVDALPAVQRPAGRGRERPHLPLRRQLALGDGEPRAEAARAKAFRGRLAQLRAVRHVRGDGGRQRGQRGRNRLLPAERRLPGHGPVPRSAQRLGGRREPDAPLASRRRDPHDRGLRVRTGPPVARHRHPLRRHGRARLRRPEDVLPVALRRLAPERLPGPVRRGAEARRAVHAAQQVLLHRDVLGVPGDAGERRRADPGRRAGRTRPHDPRRPPEDLRGSARGGRPRSTRAPSGTTSWGDSSSPGSATPSRRTSPSSPSSPSRTPSTTAAIPSCPSLRWGWRATRRPPCSLPTWSTA